jgi:isoquinoline 1-oxidoreductase subunit beta
MRSKTKVNRREFLKTGVVFSGGLLISFYIPETISRSAKPASNEMFRPNAFLRIGTDNSIDIILTKVEMGQGIWTTLAILIAEELDCDWNKINIEHSPVSKEYNHIDFPMQATVGSSSTISEFDRYRTAGATARVMLVEAAAKRMGVTVELCRTEKGYVFAGDKKISYGEVCLDAAKLAVPAVRLREPKDWKYIGKPQKRLDGLIKINGQARFGIDIRFPGLLIAVVAHSPVFGGKVKSFDSTQAKTIKGVRDIVQIPSGIAVIGDHYWAAKQGRDALKIEWDHGINENIDTKKQIEEYRILSKTNGISAQQNGDTVKEMKNSVRTIDAEFMMPYLAHAPMEPLNCTVKISKDECEIWTGTQLPTLDRANVAKVLSFEPEQVKINTPFLGGSFGRRGSFNSEWIVEAVHIAKTSGRFIKLIWSREDDIQGGYYRPLYLHSVRIGVDQNGMPVAWQHTIVGQSVFSFTPVKGNVALEVDDSSVEGIKDSPYFESIPNYSIELHTTFVGVPILPWRSVGFSQNIFVMESLIDELADITGKDPVQFRRSLLKDHPRHLAVLNLAAEKAQWESTLPQGIYHGVAVGERSGTYVAHVIEVSAEKTKLRIKRVVCAIDCGLAVNPDGVVAQMESGIVFGLTAALYGEITLEKGRVQQSNFHNYKMLRMGETPVIEVHIVSSSNQMGGAGEPGVPTVAPALTNALYAATRKRIRNLPVRIEELIEKQEDQ